MTVDFLKDTNMALLDKLENKRKSDTIRVASVWVTEDS